MSDLAFAARRGRCAKLARHIVSRWRGPALRLTLEMGTWDGSERRHRRWKGHSGPSSTRRRKDDDIMFDPKSIAWPADGDRHGGMNRSAGFDSEKGEIGVLGLGAMSMGGGLGGALMGSLGAGRAKKTASCSSRSRPRSWCAEPLRRKRGLKAVSLLAINLDRDAERSYFSGRSPRPRI